jgi:hypothetical protein
MDLGSHDCIEKLAEATTIVARKGTAIYIDIHTHTHGTKHASRVKSVDGNLERSSSRAASKGELFLLLSACLHIMQKEGNKNPSAGVSDVCVCFMSVSHAGGAAIVISSLR